MGLGQDLKRTLGGIGGGPIFDFDRGTQVFRSSFAATAPLSYANAMFSKRKTLVVVSTKAKDWEAL